jgi:hypothetical protein
MAAVLLGWGWSDFVAREATLYEADHVAYWSMTTSLADAFVREPLTTVWTVARSVDERELNLLPSVPLVPAILAFGPGRSTYIVAVAVGYALPALLLGWWALRRWSNSDAPSPSMSHSAAWATGCALFTILWEPVGLGYLDIGGLIPAFIVLALVLRPEEDQSDAVAPVLVGVLLALLALFRRWYGIWTAALVVVLVMELAWDVARGRRSWSHLRFRVAAVVAAIVTTVLLAPGRVLNVVSTDYGDRFIHYDSGSSWIGDLMSFGNQFGWLAMVVFAGGAVASLATPSARRGTVLLLVHLGLVHGVFRSIQDPSPQHWYLILPGMLLITARGLLELPRWLPRPWSRGLQVGVIVVAVNIASQTVGLINWIGPPFGPSRQIQPMQRSDLDEVRRLMDLLDARIRAGSGLVAVLAGGGPLTDTALAFANHSLGTRYRCPERVITGSHVDLRDGFPDALVAADLVVVPDPGQFRRPPTTQRVVSEPTRDFATGTGIAAGFSAHPQHFILGDGVRFTVHERFRTTRPAELEALSSRLRAWYPDRPFVWQPRSLRDPDEPR